MNKGYLASGMLYTLLIISMVLMITFLNNLQSKKTILDTLKEEVIATLNS